MAPVSRRPLGADESARVNRAWWDAEAPGYLAEHGAFLGDARFVWGPEGLSEDEAALLGEVSGRSVLEVGAGAAQCSRWLLARGARPVAVDISGAMLRAGAELGRRSGLELPLLQADAARLPLVDGAFDLACSSYGALPFVADAGRVLHEVARVLRAGGRWVFSVSHPVRWAFPDDPGPGGLVATMSYFDRRPYVEHADDGTVAYAEHHRTMGDWVRLLDSAGFRLREVVEPEWPADNSRTWGGWSPLRGDLIPGTAIFVSELQP